MNTTTFPNEKPTTLVNDSIIELSNSISRMTQGARFISFYYKSKSTGEEAIHTLLVGFSYHNLVLKSVDELTPILEGLKFQAARGVDLGLQLEAAQSVMDSLQKTLAAHEAGTQNDDYTKKGMYLPVANGVNINGNDNTIQVFGLSISKKVLVKGTYKEVKSRPLTIAKNKVKENLSVDKFREFALDKDVILKGKVNGETFECVTPETFVMDLNSTETVTI